MDSTGALPSSSTASLHASGTAAAATGGSGRSAGVVAAALAASATHLRGDYVGRLNVRFSNGASQEVGLRAEVLRPTIVAAPSSVVFGSVRVAPPPTTVALLPGIAAAALRVIYLSNPTSVDAVWTLKHSPQPPVPRRAGAEVDWRSLGLQPSSLWSPPPGAPPPIDDPTVWTFSATAGVLSGPTAPAELAEAATLRSNPDMPSPVAVRVSFAPRTDAVYMSRFRITVRQGPSLDIVLVGQGTHEEQGAGDRAQIA